MSILDTRVLLLSLPQLDAAPPTKGLQKSGRGTIELVEEPGSATGHGSVRAVPEVSKMPDVPRDIFRAATDGTKAEMLYVIREENDDPRPPPLKEMDIAKIRAWIERGGDVNGDSGPPFELESTVFEGEIIPVLYPGARLLTVAAECGRVDVMRLLIAGGAAINHVTRVPTENVPSPFNHYLMAYGRGRSALMAAACRNQEGAVRLLIEHGADVNFEADDGWVASLRLVWGTPAS